MNRLLMKWAVCRHEPSVSSLLVRPRWEMIHVKPAHDHEQVPERPLIAPAARGQAIALPDRGRCRAPCPQR